MDELNVENSIVFSLSRNSLLAKTSINPLANEDAVQKLAQVLVTNLYTVAQSYTTNVGTLSYTLTAGDPVNISPLMSPSVYNVCSSLPVMYSSWFHGDGSVPIIICLLTYLFIGRVSVTVIDWSVAEA